jgi:hypothetical protein
MKQLLLLQMPGTVHPSNQWELLHHYYDPNFLVYHVLEYPAQVLDPVELLLCLHLCSDYFSSYGRLILSSLKMLSRILYMLELHLHDSVM